MGYGTKHALPGCAELHPTVGFVSSQTVIGAGPAANAGAVVGVALEAAARALASTLHMGMEEQKAGVGWVGCWMRTLKLVYTDWMQQQRRLVADMCSTWYVC